MNARARFYCCRHWDSPPVIPTGAVDVLLALVADWITQDTPARYRGRAARAKSNLTRSDWSRGMRFLLDAGLVISEPARFIVLIPEDFAAVLERHAAHLTEWADEFRDWSKQLESSEDVIPDTLDVDELRDLFPVD